MSRLLITILFSVLWLHTATGQAGGRTITREQAVRDIDFMVDFVRSTHPDMFAVYPETEFYLHVERAKSSLPKRMNLLEFYRAAGDILPLLEDGHTMLFTPRNAIGPQDRIFPYHVDIDPADSSLTVRENGKRIISVNNISSREICGRMARYVSGESAAYRLVSRVAGTFPMFMKLLWPADRYLIEYEDGEMESIRSVKVSDFLQNNANLPHKPKHYSYTIREDISACIFDFRQFTDPEQFKLFLKGMFSEIDELNIVNLIIDIRNNPGGNSSLGDELFQYISPVPFNQFGDTEIRFSKFVRESFPELNLQAEDTTIVYRSSPSKMIPLRDNPLRFAGKGRIWLMTDIKTFSSASKFAWAFRYFNMGVTVGQETGGRIVSFGDMVTANLPESGLKVGCSWKKFYGYGAAEYLAERAEQTGQTDIPGVIPDYPVPAEKAWGLVMKQLIGQPSIAIREELSSEISNPIRLINQAPEGYYPIRSFGKRFFWPMNLNVGSPLLDLEV